MFCSIYDKEAAAQRRRRKVAENLPGSSPIHKLPRNRRRLGEYLGTPNTHR